ncbi:MAG TPA: glycerol-3-phosphate acyltransferase, partial [Thermoanaerobaculia bacterium]|nr:glycerol-3-phosphate acyltransferase [Thermoanaerobaculia bacterium]
MGAIPWSWVLVRWKTGQDIRQVGSGNVGATNAM